MLEKYESFSTKEKEEFRDICNEIKNYIEYYNNYRYQWNLKKMTPVKYRNHLLENLA